MSDVTKGTYSAVKICSSTRQTEYCGIVVAPAIFSDLALEQAKTESSEILVRVNSVHCQPSGKKLSDRSGRTTPMWDSWWYWLGPAAAVCMVGSMLLFLHWWVIQLPEDPGPIRDDEGPWWSD